MVAIIGGSSDMGAFARVEVYLFASSANTNTHRPLFFSMTDQDVQSITNIACFGEAALTRVVPDSGDTSVASKVIVC